MSTESTLVENSQKFGIQVKQFDVSSQKMNWLWVHPTNGDPYQFDSKAKAQHMRDICYPMCDQSQVRVHPFKEVEGVLQ